MLNGPADPFHPHCKYCKGTGFVGPLVCSCYLNVRAASEMEKLRMEKFRKEQRRADIIMLIWLICALAIGITVFFM